ncbi:PLP-dependent aminotransferase family protein [Brevibacterium ravenspurgense]|uniref:MocR-like pyridoxine biosynthesis transcription factor PdxR n=1 Tax=Brevibacterium ravenspurgense TaxID=479117 RepID=UPI0009ED853C|nr:PLP-dependent aminotransferase family protein [Brevibacterium ravenspurgense]
MARTPRPVTLPVSVDRSTSVSLPVQIAGQLRSLIETGTLVPGTELPSTRSLARLAGVSRGTVVAAYEQLTAEGCIVAAEGSGTIVSPDLAAVPRPAAAEHPPTPTKPHNRGQAPRTSRESESEGAAADEFRANDQTDAARRSSRGSAGAGSTSSISLLPSRVDGSGVVSPMWRAAWRAAAREAEEDFREGSSEPLGLAELRVAFADRLRRVRGMPASAERVVVTAGARDGLRLVLDCLQLRMGPGGEATGSAGSAGAAGSTAAGRPVLSIGIESPGYPGLRRVVEALGHRLIPVPVDDHGLVPEQIPNGLDALIVTPSHQYPLGGSLPLARRLAVLAAAQAHGFAVIEDDHTAEFRWDAAPLPTLAGLAVSERAPVVLLSSLASLISPGIALGHLHVPAEWIDDLAVLRAQLGAPVSRILQRAAARLIESGGLERHAAAVRTQHRIKLDVVRTVLGRAPGFHVDEVPGGLAAVVTVDLPEAELVAGAQAHGVQVQPLSEYWAGQGPGGVGDGGLPDGIVVGFGGPEDELHTGLRRLVEAARSLR